jgi:2-haloacid dehalogenase
VDDPRSTHAVFAFGGHGTLFDVRAAMARDYAACGAEVDGFSQLWRLKQLEYLDADTGGRHLNFWTLTGRALDFALAHLPSVDKSQMVRSLSDARYLSDARAAWHT